MLPIQLIACLFTATVTGATTKFVSLGSYSLIIWFMYLYLVAYRIKVFLDDLVYYKNIKEHAVGGGDPIVGLVTWILWITIALLLGNEVAYFGLTSLTFGIGVIWVTIAKRNIPMDVPQEIKPVVEQVKLAHSRWWRFNLIPFLIGGSYFVLYTVGVNINWMNFWSWLGPAAMTGSLVWDIITDYRFMFQLDVPKT